MAADAKKNPAKTPASHRKAAGATPKVSPPKASLKPLRKPRVATFRFGGFTVKTRARDEEWAHNIGLGQEAMQKIQAALVKPGVKLRTPKATPLFRADPDRPGQLIRVLDGKEERGIIVDGVFKIRR
jgi:hypothetical protein